MTQVLPGYLLDSRFAARVILAHGLWDSRRSSKCFKPLVDPVEAARRYPVPQERFLEKLKIQCTAHKALPVNQSQAVHDKNTWFRFHLVTYICLTVPIRSELAFLFSFHCVNSKIHKTRTLYFTGMAERILNSGEAYKRVNGALTL